MLYSWLDGLDCWTNEACHQNPIMMFMPISVSVSVRVHVRGRCRSRGSDRVRVMFRVNIRVLRRHC